MRILLRVLVLIAVVLLFPCSGSAQPRRSKASAARVEPFPSFSFDSLRYALRFPAELGRAGRSGTARVLVRLNAAGRMTITHDRRNDKEFGEALASALGKVRFMPAQQGGRRIASAVTVTAWFLHDTSYKRRIPFVDIALDSASAFTSAVERTEMLRATGTNLLPVYSEHDLAGHLSYPQGIPHGAVADTAIIHVLVERSGTAEHTNVEKTPHPLLGLAAEDAVRSIRFAPAMQLGTPVAMWIDVPVIFRWK